MATIEFEQVTRRFNSTLAVDRVSLTVADGEFLVLLGPSGCGKTTLLRMLAGLLEPSSGRIRLDGEDITDLPSGRRDLAMVFQSYALYPHLTVAKNLAFPLRTRRLARAETARRVSEVAQTLQIEHLLARRPKELSGGQRQRVAVGRALVREPMAYLMDEPLSNLDAKLRTATRHELTDLHARLGSTFVYVTHDQVEAMTMATKIAVLNEGHLEQYGTPDEVYDRPASRFVAGFLGSPAMNLFDAEVDADGLGLVVSGDGLAGRLWEGRSPRIPVTLGVRAEHLRPADEVAAPAVRLEGTVVRSENLGHEELVMLAVGPTRAVMRRPRTGRVQATDRVSLAVELDHVHLFERDGGRRLEWAPDDEPATVDDLLISPLS